MSSLQTYTFDGQLNVRTIIDDKGEPLFVAKDVAVALGFKDTVSAISQHCSEGIDAQSFRKQALRSQGGPGTLPIEIKDLHPQTLLIREPDVYALIFGSKLATAEKFKTWVFNEVLPSIRKTGKRLQKIAKDLESINYLPDNRYITIENGVAFTTSKIISTNFEIRHDNLLQHIDNKIKNIQNLDNNDIIKILNLPNTNNTTEGALTTQDSSKFGLENNHLEITSDVLTKLNEFIQFNFIEYFYTSKDNKLIRQYKLTEQGFSFIVMGLSGVKADLYKIAFIKAFYDMRKTIENRVKSSHLRHVFPEKNNNGQYVYIIKNPFNNVFKVGISKNVDSRLKQLQTGAGVELELTYRSMLCTNAIEIESNVHKKYKNFKVFGEWFNYPYIQEIIDYIEINLVKLDSNFESLNKLCDKTSITGYMYCSLTIQ